MSVQNSYSVELASSLAVLAVGISLQISGYYAPHLAHPRLNGAFAQTFSYLGSTALGYYLPRYIRKKTKKNPTVAKVVTAAALVGLFTGTFLTGLDTKYPATDVCGHYLAMASGVALFSILIKDRDSQKENSPSSGQTGHATDYRRPSASKRGPAVRTEASETRRNLQLAAAVARMHKEEVAS